MRNKNNVAAFLAITAMLGFLLVFCILAFAKVPTENEKYFYMGFIALIGNVGTAFGYYLGSSLSSASKTALLASPPYATETAKNDAGFSALRLVIAMALASLCLLFVVGCSGNRSAKGLIAAKEMTIAVGTGAAALCTAGKIPPAACARAANLYAQVPTAYATAVDALLLQIATGSGGSAGQLVAFNSLASDLLQIGLQYNIVKPPEVK